MIWDEKDGSGNSINNTLYKADYEYIDGKKIKKIKNKFKVIIMGMESVGKSSIFSYISNKVYSKNSNSITNQSIYFKANVNNKVFYVQLCDTINNEQSLKTQNPFKNVSLAIFVYSINDRNSFEQIEKLYNILNKNSVDSMKFLIGNKSDLNREREVSKEEGEKIKKNYDFKYFSETSTKLNYNLDELMNNILNSLYTKIVEVDDSEETFRKSDLEDLQRNSDVIEYDENGNIVKIRRKKKGKCQII